MSFRFWVNIGGFMHPGWLERAVFLWENGTHFDEDVSEDQLRFEETVRDLMLAGF